MQISSPVKQLQFYSLLAAATYLSLTPQPHPAMALVSDKLIHAAGYCGLMISAHIAHAPNSRRLEKIIWLLAYSVLIEVIQHFVPGRSFSLLDMAANLAGLLLGTKAVFLACRAIGTP